MRSNATLALHYLFRGLLCAGFSLYILYLVNANLLSYYIAPRMEILVKLGAVALSMLAVYQWYAAFLLWRGQQAGSCGCDHAPSPSKLRNTIAYALFLTPLVFGYFTPDTVMGSNVVDKKGIVLNSGGGASSLVPDTGIDSAPREGGLFSSTDPYVQQYAPFAEQLFLQNPIVVGEETYLETSTAIDIFMRPFQGKSIQIEGFVYKQDDMSDTQFVVARLAMECCSADATPYGFLVQWPEAAALPKDVWVSVTGTIGATDYGGMEIVTIQAEHIEHIETPETPYVYPNYDVLSSVIDL